MIKTLAEYGREGGIASGKIRQLNQIQKYLDYSKTHGLAQTLIIFRREIWLLGYQACERKYREQSNR